MPSEMPVRMASSSTFSGCLACPRCQAPWPTAGTVVPSGNRTVCTIGSDAVPVAASRRPLRAGIANEAAQRALNWRRLSKSLSTVFLHFRPAGQVYTPEVFGSRGSERGRYGEPPLALIPRGSQLPVNVGRMQDAARIDDGAVEPQCNRKDGFKQKRVAVRVLPRRRPVNVHVVIESKLVVGLIPCRDFLVSGPSMTVKRSAVECRSGGFRLG